LHSAGASQQGMQPIESGMGRVGPLWPRGTAGRKPDHEGVSMRGFSSGFSYGFRVAAIGLITTIAAVSLTATTADAKKRTKAAKAHRAKVVKFIPPYSAIVVDANSGKVLHEASADAPRHPASVTK